MAVLAFVVTTAPVQAQDDIPGDEIAAAWAEGDLQTVASLGRRAFDSIAESRCAMSPDAARLAYVAGFAGLDPQVSIERGYLFWVASTINEEVGGLTDAEAATASYFASGPGQNTAYDRAYATSSYFLDPPEPGTDCPEQFTQALVSPPAQSVDHLIVLMEARGERADFFRDIVLINGYPLDEAAAFAERLESLSPYQPELYWSRSREYAPNDEHYFRVSDCRTFWNRDRDRVEICREGHPDAG